MDIKKTFYNSGSQSSIHILKGITFVGAGQGEHIIFEIEYWNEQDWGRAVRQSVGPHG